MSVLAAPLPQPTSAIDAPLLRARDLHAGFGSHAVLHGVSLEVRNGDIAGVFGLNGAGKSVTMKVLAGLLPAWSGRVEYAGRDITGISVEERVRRGVGNVPQGRQVFPELTVEQNLRLGAYQLRRRDKSRYGLVLGQVYERFPVLAQRRTQLAGTMSGGEQASLAVARALMSEPRLLLVDEPSAGLAPKVVEELFAVLAELNSEGLTILLVEQNVTFGLQLVHTAHLLRTGRVVYSGNVAELDRERVVTELGIGRLLGGLHPKPGLPAKPPLPPGPPTTGRRAAPGRSIKRGKI
jgi:branched-chain amino acid transport system ATP-binding protein